MQARHAIPTLAAVVSLAAAAAPVANASNLAPVNENHTIVLAAPHSVSQTHRRKNTRQPQIHKELVDSGGVGIHKN